MKQSMRFTDAYAVPLCSPSRASILSDQRVPLFVRWPHQIQDGSLSDAIVGPIDLYSTNLDAVQLKKTKNHFLDGVSFLPVLQQKGRLERKSLFT